MSTAKDENQREFVGKDPGGEAPVIDKKVVETVDYRSPASAEPGDVQEKPVSIVHEILGGEKDKSSAPKQD